MINKIFRGKLFLTIGIILSLLLVSTGVFANEVNGTTGCVDEVTDCEEIVPEKFGSILVCKIILDIDGNIIDGAGLNGEFTIIDTGDSRAADTFPTTSFNLPLTLNTDLLGDKGNDAECILHENLKWGSYFYDEEVVVGSDWLAPLYNDQINDAFITLSDVFPYSLTNGDSNGHIDFRQKGPDRTLVIVNQSNAPKEVLGSISVCKIVLDEDGNIVDGTGLTGEFSIGPRGDDRNREVGVLPTSVFTLPLTLNTDLLGDEGSDAECIVYEDLTLGSYFLGEEVIQGENWATPLYNDQLRVDFNAVTDAFPYDLKNANSNGHISLIQKGPNRTLVVVNQYEGEGSCEQDESCESLNAVPLITLIEGTVNLIVGDTFVDPGATAEDLEDGDITSEIVVGGDAVDVNTIGTYQITYDVTDSQGEFAPQVVRDVIVSPASTPPGGGGGGQTIQRIIINDGDVETTTANVSLEIIPQESAREMMVGNDSEFTDGVWEDYSRTKDWVLGSVSGLKTVYVKFRVGQNPVGSAVSDDIILKLGEVLGATIDLEDTVGSCGKYLNSYLKLGGENDAGEVKRLQTFLNDHGYGEVPVTGFFGVLTFEAVKKFQFAEKESVLDPWIPYGLLPNTSTGFVYKTTIRRINEIMCPDLQFPPLQIP